MANYKKNLRLVEEHLQQDEVIKYSIFGAYNCKILGKNSARNGVFIVTNSRIVFFAKKLIGYNLESFPLENISSFECLIVSVLKPSMVRPASVEYSLIIAFADNPSFSTII